MPTWRLGSGGVLPAVRVAGAGLYRFVGSGSKSWMMPPTAVSFIAFSPGSHTQDSLPLSATPPGALDSLRAGAATVLISGPLVCTSEQMLNK